MFQLYLHRSFLGFITTVLTCFFCAKGCKKHTPSFVAFSDTQVNCRFCLFSGFFFYSLRMLMSCLPMLSF